MTRTESQNLAEKRDAFLDATGTRKTAFITMITCFGTKENQFYRDVVDNQITMDALFAEGP